MEKYLLDTSICIFLMRGMHNLAKEIEKVGIENCFISEITHAELLYGAECSNRPKEILKVITEFCKRVSIIPISNSLHEFARQKAILRKKGTPVDDFDLLIACSAVTGNFIMVTDNTKHFDRIEGIRLINWVSR